MLHGRGGGGGGEGCMCAHTVFVETDFNEIVVQVLAWGPWKPQEGVPSMGGEPKEVPPPTGCTTYWGP